MESLVTSQLVLSNKTSKIISPILSSQIQSGDFGKFMPSSQVNSKFLNKCSEDEANTIIRELQNGKSSEIAIGYQKTIKNYQSNSIFTNSVR